MRTIITQPMSDSTKYRKLFSITATANTQSFFFGNQGRGFAKFSIVVMNTGSGAFSTADFILYNYNGTNKIFCTKSNNNISVFGVIANDTFTVYAKGIVNFDFIVMFESSYEDMFSFYDYDMTLYDKASFTSPIGISTLVNQPITLPITWESGYTADSLSYTNNNVEISENGRYMKGQIVFTTTNTTMQNMFTLPMPIQKTRWFGMAVDSNNVGHPFLVLQNQGTGMISTFMVTSNLGASISRYFIEIDSPIFASSYPKGITIPGV